MAAVVSLVSDQTAQCSPCSNHTQELQTRANFWCKVQVLGAVGKIGGGTSPPPPPEGSTIFGGGTKIFPPFPPQISYDTFCKETYQRGPSQLTAMSPHSLFPNRASRRWEYSHLARSLPCFADQNLLGSHNTLTGGCSILIRKSL